MSFQPNAELRFRRPDFKMVVPVLLFITRFEELSSPYIVSSMECLFLYITIPNEITEGINTATYDQGGSRISGVDTPSADIKPVVCKWHRTVMEGRTFFTF